VSSCKCIPFDTDCASLTETEQDGRPKIFEDKVIISKREYSTRGGGEANYLKSKRENRISKKAPEKKKPVMISAVSS
jgi:hypothetical protein